MAKLRDTRNASSTKNLKTNAQWLKNATRSLGVTGLDVLKDISPNIYDVSENISKDASKVFKNISTSKNSQTSISNVLSKNTYVKMAKTGLNNALRDLKTGEFNSRVKEKNGSSSGEEASATYFDSVDDGASPDSEGSKQIVVNKIDSEGFTRVSNAVNRQSQTTIKAAEATINSIVAVSSAQMMQNQQLGNAVVSELKNINTSLQSIITYNNDNMTKFIQSSMAFMDKVGAKVAPKEEDSKDASDLFGKHGTFSTSDYLKLVKKQGKNAVGSSQLGMIGTMLKMAGDDIARNPLEYVSKALIEKAIPDVIQSTMKEVDKTVGEFIPTMLSKLYDWGEKGNLVGGYKGEVQKIIGKTFGINIESKKGLDFSGKINKDAATFDGVTKTAIVEELPKYARESAGYLREIVTLLGGDANKAVNNSLILNRRTGEYQKKSDYDKELMESISGSIRAAFNDSSFGKQLNIIGSKLNDSDNAKFNEGLNKFYIELQKIKKNNFTEADTRQGGDLYNIINSLDNVDPSMKALLLSSVQSTFSSRNGGLSLTSANIKAKSARNRAMMGLEQDFDMNRSIGLYKKKYDEYGEEKPMDESMISVLYGNSKKMSSRDKAKGSLMDSILDIRFLLNRGINVKVVPGEPYGDYGSDSSGRSNRTTNTGSNATVSTNTNSSNDKNVSDMTPEEIAELTHINDPLDEKDNDSRTSRFVKNKGKHAKNFMYLMASGKSALAMNEIHEMFGDVASDIGYKAKTKIFEPLKDKIIGDPDNPDESILGTLKKTFKSVKADTKRFIFGDAETGERGHGVIGAISNMWHDGMDNWKKEVFGTDPNASAEDIKKAIAKKRRNIGVGAIAGAGIATATGGILGNLVGGPVAGAILGSAVGWASNSERFQDFVFGKKNENGERDNSGLISKSTQNWFKDPKNRTAVVGGATIGLLKGAILGGGGLLGGLVGGPMAGAILGATTGMITRSKKFQELIYGKEDENGDKVGGILNTFKNWKDSIGRDKDTGEIKGSKLASMTAVSSGTGLLLGMFTPAGPVGGAAIGLAASMIANKSKFKEFLFGKKDANGEYAEIGLTGRLANTLKTDVFVPLKNTVANVAEDAIDAFSDNVLEPLKVAFEPVKIAGQRMYDATLGRIKDKLDETGDFIKTTLKNAATSVSKTVTKAITMPFKGLGKLFGKLFNGVTKTTGGIIGGIGQLATKSNKKASVRRVEKDPNYNKLVEKWKGEYNKLDNPGMSWREYLQNKKENAYYSNRYDFIGAREKRAARNEEKESRRAEQKRLENEGRIASRLSGGKYTSITDDNRQELLSAYKKSKGYLKGKGLKGISQKEILKSLGEVGIEKDENGNITNLKSLEKNAITQEEQLQYQKDNLPYLSKIFDTLDKVFGDFSIKDSIANKRKTNVNARVANIEEKYGLKAGSLHGLATSKRDARKLEEQVRSQFGMSDYEGNEEEYVKGVTAKKDYRPHYIKKQEASEKNKRTKNAEYEAALEKEFKLKEGSLSGTITSKKDYEKQRALYTAKQKGMDKTGLDLDLFAGTNAVEKAKNKIALASHYAKQKKIARRARQDYNTAATLDSINKLKSFGGGFGKFAKGGQPGGNDDINVSVVGEEGPEVLLHGPNKKGTIIPADQAINVKLVGVEEAAQKALTPKDGIQNVNLVGQDDPITTYAMGPQFNQYTDAKTKIMKALRTPNKLVSSEDIAQDIGDKDRDDKSDTKEKEKSSMWDKIKDFLKKGAGLAAIAGLAGLLMKNWDKIKDFIQNIGPTIANIGKAIIDTVKDTADHVKTSAERGQESLGSDKTSAEKAQEVRDEWASLVTGDAETFIMGEDGKYDHQSQAKTKLLGRGLYKMLGGKKLGEGAIRSSKEILNGSRAVGKAAKNAPVAIKTGVKTAKEFAGKAGAKVVNGAKKATGTIKTVGSKMGNTKVGNTVKTGAKKVGAAVKDKAGAVAEKVGNSKIISKVKDMAVKAKDLISSALEKKGIKNNKIGAKITEVLDKAIKYLSESKAGSKVAGFVKKAMQKLAKFFGFTTAAISTGIGVVAVLANDAVQITSGALNGLTKAGTAKLFRCKEEDVDVTMRLISAAMGAIAGTDPGTVVDILNEMVTAITGVDLFSELATAIYSLIMKATGQNDKYENLVKSQDEQYAEYETYKDEKREESYQQYLLDNDLSEATFTREQFDQKVESGEATVDYDSYADWNDQQHQTIGDKVSKAVTTAGVKAVKGVKKGFKVIGKGIGAAKNAVVGGAKKAWGGVKSVASAGIEKAVELKNTVTGVAKAGIQGITGLFKDPAQTAKNALNFGKKILAGAKDYLSGKTDSIEISSDTDDEETKAVNNLVARIAERALRLPKMISNVFNGIMDIFNKDDSAGDETSTSDGKSGKKKPSKIKQLWNLVTTGLGGSGGINVPQYSQKDSEWANMPYEQGGRGPETMRNAGCGPTAFAMAASAATKHKITPVESAVMMQRVGARDKTGTNWSGMQNAASAYGIPSQMSVMPSENFVDQSLKAGKPVILSGRSGGYGNTPYTAGGHYVVATGIDSNGNYKINDPNSKVGDKRYNKADLLNHTGAAWAFGGKGPNGMPSNVEANVAGMNKTNLTKESSNVTYDTSMSKIPTSVQEQMKKQGTYEKFQTMYNNTSGMQDTQKWMSIVKAVKQALAQSGKEYNQSGSVDITIGEKTLSVRTDCSGFVSACLKFYGVLDDNTNLTSSVLAGDSPQMQNSGFTGGGFPGWDGCKEGDILAISGHTEIFSHMEGSTPYVYNCGSTKSLQSAEPTPTGHKSGYTKVWRPGPAGTGCVSSYDASSGASVDGSSGGIGSLFKSDDRSTNIFSAIASWAGEFGKRALQGITTGQFNNDWSGWLNGDESTSLSDALGLSSGSDASVDSSYDSSASAGLSASETAKKVWDYLKQKGFTDEAAAGIMGNLQQESGMNASSHQKGGPAKGLCQWEGGRWTNLQKFAQQRGKSEWDLDTQLDFMLHELDGGDATTASQLKKKCGGLEGLKKLTNVGQAADAFEQSFERAGKPMMEKRYAYANDYYSSLKGSSPSYASSSIPTSALNAANQQGTAYQIFSGNGGFGDMIVDNSNDLTQQASASVDTTATKNNNYTAPEVKPLPSKAGGSDYAKKIVEYLSAVLDVLSDSNSKIGNLGSTFKSEIGQIAKGTTNNGVNVNNINTTNNVNGSPAQQQAPKTTSPGFTTAYTIARGGL